MAGEKAGEKAGETAGGTTWSSARNPEAEDCLGVGAAMGVAAGRKTGDSPTRRGAETEDSPSKMAETAEENPRARATERLKENFIGNSDCDYLDAVSLICERKRQVAVISTTRAPLLQTGTKLLIG